MAKPNDTEPSQGAVDSLFGAVGVLWDLFSSFGETDSEVASEDDEEGAEYIDTDGEELDEED